MSDEKLTDEAARISKAIKIELLERDMKQVQLSAIIRERPQQVNAAINGDVTPKSKRIRAKIYKVLGMEESE